MRGKQRCLRRATVRHLVQRAVGEWATGYALSRECPSVSLEVSQSPVRPLSDARAIYVALPDGAERITACVGAALRGCQATPAPPPTPPTGS